MSYKVKLNFFEGPLDLLLFLLKKERIDIYDIPISKITEQYLEYMELIEMLDLEVAGEFLVMAATLMHIKSKMLLPVEETPGEEEKEEDPRDELVRRLLEYKRFKEAAEGLKEMFDERKDIFLRQGLAEKEIVVEDDGESYFEASLFDLITAFRSVLSNVSKPEFFEVVRNKFTVSEKMVFIEQVMKDKKILSFTALFKDDSTKEEVITTFLAVLELIKMKVLAVAQKEAMGQIQIIKIKNADQR